VLWYDTNEAKRMAKKPEKEIKIKEIIKGNDLCVLATVSGGKPHCSLMSYCADEEGRTLYLASHKETRKYVSAMENPTVSLLIDTREGVRGGTRTAIQALTASGEFQAIKDPAEKERAKTQFMQKHLHLRAFLDEPGVEIFSIKITSFQVLDGIKDAYFETID
jgi:nitroimidazol reductase NimA-like FMN-containing flavoprotein (pyridoxamine 5'-phosphate oxidase superfamily)